MRDGMRTIPVPQGWSPEQAFEHVRRGHLLVDPDPWWALVLVEGDALVYVLEESRSPDFNDKWKV